MHGLLTDALDWLSTKSDAFQGKFLGMAEEIEKYFSTDEQRQEFWKNLVSTPSFSGAERLYATKKQFGGNPDSEKLKEDIHHFLLWLFDFFGSSEMMEEATHVIVCVCASTGSMTEEDMSFLQKLLSFEWMCRECFPAAVTTLLKENAEAQYAECYVACLK